MIICTGTWGIDHHSLAHSANPLILFSNVTQIYVAHYFHASYCRPSWSPPPSGMPCRPSIYLSWFQSRRSAVANGRDLAKYTEAPFALLWRHVPALETQRRWDGLSAITCLLKELEETLKNQNDGKTVSFLSVAVRMTQCSHWWNKTSLKNVQSPDRVIPMKTHPQRWVCWDGAEIAVRTAFNFHYRQSTLRSKEEIACPWLFLDKKRFAEILERSQLRVTFRGLCPTLKVLRVQIDLLREKPGLQAHMYDPMVSRQFEYAPQTAILPKHSSMLLHVVPFQENPVSHLQVNEPGVLVQRACRWQSWICATHSSTSEHCLPLNVYPLTHWHSNEPSVSKQTLPPWQMFCDVRHSLIFTHSVPSPEYPFPHWQW